MNNFTLSDMEEKTKIPAQSINRYELGQRVPKIDTVTELSETLNVNPLWLMGFDVSIDFEQFSDATKRNESSLKLEVSEASHIKKYRILDERGKGTVDSVLNMEYERALEIEERIPHSRGRASSET